MDQAATGAPANAVTHPLARYDARRLAHYETVNWVAYYQKRWGALLQASVGMVREAFSLSLPQGIYAAYLVARAEMAASPFPDNDIPTAEAYMQRFYRYIKKVHDLNYDVNRIAKLEVNWWVVHRALFNDENKQPLVEALYDLYVNGYGAEPQGARRAAVARTRAMVYSDDWIKQGKPDNSPLVEQEENALLDCYVALQTALNRQ